MSDSFSQILIFAFLPFGTAVLGGTLAAFRPPGPMARSYIQHLAAGVVFSVVAVELLPDIVREHTAWVEVAVGFSLGVICMLALRAFSHKLEAKGDDSPLGILVGVGIDIFLDGLLISISFAAGGKAGTLLTIALALELLTLGLAVGVALGENQEVAWKVIGGTALLFLLVILGAALGALVLRFIPPSILEILLSFGLAALLYLVTEELLVEAHKKPETPAATGMFFAGFLVFLLLGMVS